MSRPKRRPARHRIGGLLACTLLPPAAALLLRVRAAEALDLRAMPGPGGVKILAALVEGDTGRDWCTWLLAALRPLLPGADVLADARQGMLLGGAAAALGAALAGLALGGWRAGLAAGLLVACWAPALHTSVLIGADAPSCALTWLGVAGCWLGASRGSRGLPLAVAGAALALFGALLKVVALPAVAFAALAPLLLPRPTPARLAAWTLGLGSLLLLGGRWTLSAAEAASAVPAAAAAADGSAAALPSPGALAGALVQARDMSSEVTLQLAALGVGGALWPSRRRRLARLLLLGLSAGVLALTAHALDQKLRPRYLVPAGLGLLVLGGFGLGEVARLAARLRLGPLGWLPTLLVCLGLSLDGVAFLHGWSELRSRYTHAAPPDLPRPPIAYLAAYEDLPVIEFLDQEAVGSTELVGLARGAPPGGVATIPLFDAREFHLRAAAGLAGIPSVILDPRRCCPDQRPSAACAQALAASLQAAGARLVLPSDAGPANRIPHQHADWSRLLLRAATAAGPPTSSDTWWQVWDPPATAGAPLPCPAPPAPGRPRR